MSALNTKVLEFEPRWVPTYLLPQLSNLWHLSRVPCRTRYDRLYWTAQEFCKAYPEDVPNETAVYKDLTTMLEWGGR